MIAEGISSIIAFVTRKNSVESASIKTIFQDSRSAAADESPLGPGQVVPRDKKDYRLGTASRHLSGILAAHSGIRIWPTNRRVLWLSRRRQPVHIERLHRLRFPIRPRNDSGEAKNSIILLVALPIRDWLRSEQVVACQAVKRDQLSCPSIFFVPRPPDLSSSPLRPSPPRQHSFEIYLNIQ